MALYMRSSILRKHAREQLDSYGVDSGANCSPVREVAIQ